MVSIDDARRVAADLLRQAGDETGARVLERVDEVKRELLHSCSDWSGIVHEAGDLLAYLDPVWAAAEVERAHGEALAMHRQRSDGLRGGDAVDALRYAMVGLSETIRLSEQLTVQTSPRECVSCGYSPCLCDQQ